MLVSRSAGTLGGRHAHLHCLYEKRDEALDFQKHLRVRNIIESFRRKIDSRLAHRIPQLFDLPSPYM